MKTQSNVAYILRLALTLLVITAVVAVALAGVNSITAPKIEQLNAEKTQQAIEAVLPGGFDTQITDYTDDTGLVTKQIGMTPDKLRRLDEVLGNGMLFGHTEWGIATELEVCDHVGPLLRKLFDRIPCGPQALYEVARTHTAEWHILILVKMYEKKFPALYFPRDVIRYITQLHGAIGFDDYFLF